MRSNIRDDAVQNCRWGDISKISQWKENGYRTTRKIRSYDSRIF